MTKINKIKIKANGKYLYIKKNITVKNLLDKLNIPIKLVAIELNKKIVNKTKLNKIILKSEDKLEIVHFIGGG
tara:strand:+ start:82 stop:300 length:219 start_codon:yes stop_codon:yes gene_type:complete